MVRHTPHPSCDKPHSCCDKAAGVQTSALCPVAHMTWADSIHCHPAALPMPPPVAPQPSSGSISKALQNQSWISRKYSGSGREAEPSRRTPPHPSAGARVARKRVE